MKPKQTILWTALPGHIWTTDPFLGRARLSVMVSPRLQPTAAQGDRLDLYPDFLTWADSAARIKQFKVTFSNGKSITAKPVEPRPLEAQLWNALFKADTYVEPYQFNDLSQRVIISYPVNVVQQRLKRLYQQVTYQSGSELPFTQSLTEEMNDFNIPWNDDIARRVRFVLAAEQSHSQFGKLAVSSFQGAQGAQVSTQKGLERFLLFHNHPQEDPVQLPKTDQERAEYFKHTFDFHRAVAQTGDYPELMRRLGLVIDLVIDPSQIPLSAVEKPLAVKVTPSWRANEGVENHNASPWTAYVWDKSHFVAAPKPNAADLDNGILVANPYQYDLVQVDVDGAGIKAMNMASNLFNSFSNGSADTPQRAGLPTIRTAGVALVRAGRALGLHQALVGTAQTNTDFESGKDVLFYAEDLVRGYRVDIWDSKTGAWHSLCLRRGTYRFEDGSIERTLDDEGFTQMGTTSAANPKTPPPATGADLYLAESLFRWDGWSLVAPRPGKSIVTVPGQDDGFERVGNDPVTPFKLSTEFKPQDRTLPRLRFGWNYQLRARAADLAGNGPTLKDAGDLDGAPESKRAFEYLRYDPVINPEVVLRSLIGGDSAAGEGLERLVIRSYNTDPSLDEVASVETSERHIAPPRVSELEAEIHGMFDGPGGALLTDPATYKLIQERDEGKFQTVHDPDSNQDVPLETGAQAPMPYLPDPLARGAALRDLPHTDSGTRGKIDETGALVYAELPGLDVRPGSATLIDFSPTPKWPDLMPFRLVLAEGSKAPEWDAANRVLTVALEKTGVAVVPLSSFVFKDDLKMMGVWRWLREFINEMTVTNQNSPQSLDYIAQQIYRLDEYALEGGLWTLTPFRNLTLIHAVQQPIGHPEIKVLFSTRGEGDTSAGLVGEIAVHGSSTSKVDILSEWTELVDLLDEDGPRTLDVKAKADEIPLTVIDADAVETTTGGRAVARYFKESDMLLLGNPNPLQEFSDTKHRKVTYQVIATSRFREYFSTQLKAEDFQRLSEKATLHVNSSARPAAPLLEYVLPVYGWRRETTTNLVSSQREGGSLRVYMDRPWYSSGEDELLGVLLWPHELPSDPVDQNVKREALKPFISQWGMDPVWGSPATTTLPAIWNFTNPQTTAQGVRLPELAETVDVAAFNVGYDTGRKLWYCDIEIEAGDSYYPFIRLALARYQPYALPNEHLSKVVLADFAQLSPDRSAILTYDPYDSSTVNLIVSGLTYSSIEYPWGPINAASFVEVSAERRIAGLDPDLGWEPAGAVQVFLDATPLPGNILWRGRVNLPEDREPGEYRLVIKEFELLPVDGSGFLPVLELSQRIFWPASARRLVYADILTLP
jgi:hypothetical protein